MSPLSYKDAGVDIEAADGFVGRIRALAESTYTSGVVEHASRYAGLFRPDLEGVREPVLAATCDGVGTKLLVARQVGRFAGLGQDLVAMNVNDLLPLGARPLFFLDYVAAGKLEVDQLEEIVAGVAAACREVGCALLAGETAEMPGLYAPGDFDLAGFAVGLVDRAWLPEAGGVSVGDVVLGLPSTGVHANGLSLARSALFEHGGLTPESVDARLGRTIGEELLEPTALYVAPVLALVERFSFEAAAHVTGGGIAGRGRKLLGDGQRLKLDRDAFTVPPIFDLIAERGGVEPVEMTRTFNMGLGFLAVVKPETADAVLAETETPWLRVGEIAAGEAGVDFGDIRA